MRWYQKITVVNQVSGAINDYGDTIYSDGAGVEVSAWVQPMDATEEEINANTRISRFHVVVPKDAPVTGLSKVLWEGKSLEIVGQPTPFYNRNGLHHLEFDMREILG